MVRGIGIVFADFEYNLSKILPFFLVAQGGWVYGGSRGDGGGKYFIQSCIIH